MPVHISDVFKLFVAPAWQSHSGSARVNQVTSRLVHQQQNWELSSSGRTFISGDEWQRGFSSLWLILQGWQLERSHLDSCSRRVRESLEVWVVTLLLQCPNLDLSQLLHAWWWEVGTQLNWQAGGNQTCAIRLGRETLMDLKTLPL